MSTKVLLLVITCCIICVLSEYSNDVMEKINELKLRFPKDFKQCSRNDPDRNERFKDSLQILIKTTDHEFPIIGFPSLDPFAIRNTTFNVKRRLFDGRIEIKEGSINGLSNSLIKNVESSFENNVLDIAIDAHFPQIHLQGMYIGSVLVNKQRLAPKGHCNVKIVGADVNWRIVGDVIVVNEVEYVNITKFDITPNVQDFKFFATGLVPGPFLNNIVVNLVNSNWQGQYKKIFDDLKSEWEPLFVDMANKLFLEVPYDELFPPSV